MLSEALSGLVLTCPDKSAVYKTLHLYQKHRFPTVTLQLQLFLMHSFCLWTACYSTSHFVCVQCVYVELLCGPLPRPLTSYATWQVTNSFLIACTRKIISLFPFLGGTRQDVRAIIIASVRFPVCYFWNKYFKGRLCVRLRMCVCIALLCDCVCAHAQLCT